MIVFDATMLEKIVRNEIAINEFEMGNLKLGNLYKTIPIEEIIEIYVENNSNKFIKDASTFTIKAKFEALNFNNGCIHLAGGLSCKIENKTIANFIITDEYLTPVCNYSKEDIIKYYGKPEYELVDENVYGGYSFEINSYILVYEREGLHFSIDTKTEKIIEISAIS